MTRRVSAASLALEHQPHALYRFFDRSDVLLYVGITVDLAKRIKNHRKGKPWWTQIHNITVEHFDTRQEALDAERKAIRDEKPLHNDQHNPHVVVDYGTHPEDIDGDWIERNWPKVAPCIRDHVEVPAYDKGRCELAETLLLGFTPDELEHHYAEGRAAGVQDGEDDLDGPEAHVRAAQAAITGLQVDVAVLATSIDFFLNAIPPHVAEGVFAVRPDESMTDVRRSAWYLDRLTEMFTSARLPQMTQGVEAGRGA